MNSVIKGKPYLFISYKSDDRRIVEKIVEQLRKRYGLNIWYDSEITTGSVWEKTVKQIIRADDCCAVLFFASKKALMSSNVKIELQEATDWGKFIIPVNFVDCRFSQILREINTEYNGTIIDGMDVVDEAKYVITTLLGNDALSYIVLDENSDHFYSSIYRSLEVNAPQLIESAVQHEKEVTPQEVIPSEPVQRSAPQQTQKHSKFRKYSYLEKKNGTAERVQKNAELKKRADVLLDKAEEIGAVLDQAKCMLWYNHKPISWTVSITEKDNGGWWQKLSLIYFGKNETLHLNIHDDLDGNVMINSANVFANGASIRAGAVADADVSAEMKKVVACLYENGYLTSE